MGGIARPMGRPGCPVVNNALWRKRVVGVWLKVHTEVMWGHLWLLRRRSQSDLLLDGDSTLDEVGSRAGHPVGGVRLAPASIENLLNQSVNG